MLDDGNGRVTRKNKNTHTAKTNKCIKVERALFTTSKCLRGGLFFNIQQLKIPIFSVILVSAEVICTDEQTV